MESDGGGRPPHARQDWRGTLALCWVLAYQGFVITIGGTAAPYVAESFRLTASGTAGLFALSAIAAVAAPLLSGFADRYGRRRLLLACFAATPAAALGAAMAQSLLAFSLCVVVLFSVVGGTVAGAVVLLVENGPEGGRAHRQSIGGLAAAAGAGACLILLPMLLSRGHSWRGLLLLAASAILTFPWVAKWIAESEPWARVDREALGRRWSGRTLFAAPHSDRVKGVLVCVFLSAVSLAAADSWLYYHAVRVAGRTPAEASTLILVGGAVGLTGFPVGAWSCEKFGRVRTVTAAWMLAGVGAILFYGNPVSTLGGTWTTLLLGIEFAGLMFPTNAALVAVRLASSEPFPPGVRGAMAGWVTVFGTGGVVVAQTAIAVCAKFGLSPSQVICGLALLSAPTALLFGRVVGETRRPATN